MEGGDGSRQGTPEEMAEAMRVSVLGMLPDDVALVFGHKRLDEPLREVLLELARKGASLDGDGGLRLLAEEAERQAMAASSARDAMPNGGTRNALGLVMQAWVALYEACVFGGEEP